MLQGTECGLKFLLTFIRLPAGEKIDKELGSVADFLRLQAQTMQLYDIELVDECGALSNLLRQRASTALAKISTGC